MPYLLDTNILSDLLRHPRGRVRQRLGRVGGRSAVCTSIVVAAELRYGAEKRASPRLSAAVEELLQRLPVLPLEEPTDRRYAALRVALERAGRVIGANDLLIAAHALALDCTLVTDNTTEFARVPDLAVENWLR